MELVNIFSSLFNIEVSNYYKIYSDIKNRSTERTKFLKKLAEDFQTKLEYDDGI
ncbi:RteC domain-containing protein [Polaribacter sp. Hel1_33_78]|uniref:RteC domain-containing protein n=1 Tax=Polaribacter sp. Hel1_33_78 TaxID=1336804 RepID=UPI000B84332E